MAKLSRPVLYGGMFVAVAAAYVFLSGGDTPHSNLQGKSDSKSSKSKDTDLTPEDYSARFDGVKPQVRNVFLPLVARTKFGGGAGPTGPLGVPSELTLGEPNWVYTGMAEVNSVPQALLENSGTSDGVFLKQGEHWKQATVFRITPDVLTLVGPDGQSYEVKVLGSQQPETPAPAAQIRPLAVAPDSGLTGPIGGGNIQVVPSRRGNRSQGVTNVPNVN